MGTLYVTSVPLGDPDDTTFRALRSLRQACLVVAVDPARARSWLDLWAVQTPLVPASQAGDPLQALETGDVLLLLEGGVAAPSVLAQGLIASALRQGRRVEPVPGPSLPVTALAVSGLPAGSFVYLGLLPGAPAARRELLASVVAERRTLVVVAGDQALPDLVAELGNAWGDRPAVVVAALDRGVETVWRGGLAQAREAPPDLPGSGSWVLVAGGARESLARWEAERLWAEVRARLAQGQEAKAIGRQLAGKSGWTRREIYRMAVEAAADE